MDVDILGCERYDSITVGATFGESQYNFISLFSKSYSDIWTWTTHDKSQI